MNIASKSFYKGIKLFASATKPSTSSLVVSNEHIRLQIRASGVKGLQFSEVEDIPFKLLGLYIEEALRLDDVSKPMVVSREKR